MNSTVALLSCAKVNTLTCLPTATWRTPSSEIIFPRRRLSMTQSHSLQSSVLLSSRFVGGSEHAPIWLLVLLSTLPSALFEEKFKRGSSDLCRSWCELTRMSVCGEGPTLISQQWMELKSAKQWASRWMHTGQCSHLQAWCRAPLAWRWTPICHRNRHATTPWDLFSNTCSTLPPTRLSPPQQANADSDHECSRHRITKRILRQPNNNNNNVHLQTGKPMGCKVRKLDWDWADLNSAPSSERCGRFNIAAMPDIVLRWCFWECKTNYLWMMDWNMQYYRFGIICSTCEIGGWGYSNYCCKNIMQTSK